MKKYELSQLFKSWTNGEYSAHSKARIDADIIYRQNGFEVLYIPYVHRDKFFIWFIRRYWVGLAFLFRIKRNSLVHIQYPATGSIRWILKVLRMHGCKITLLVHDVRFLREDVNKWKDMHAFNLSDELIVHTQAMADKLKEEGLTTPVRILQLFDYLVENKEVYQETDIHSVVFAGMLERSEFLPLLIKEKSWTTNTYFYGVGKNFQLPEDSVFHYEGAFERDNVSQIKGAWGLVWDGNSIDTCGSLYGQYLKYNSSHKASLYFVAEKPIIIWRQSSLREFVETNKIGIAIDSLAEIPARLSSVTEDTYKEYVANVKEIAKKLRNGGFLSTCLK